MSQYEISALGDVARSILDAIKENLYKMSEINEKLSGLNAIIESHGKVVSDSMSLQTQAHGEFQIAIRFADIVAKEGLIKNESETIIDLENQLTEEIEKSLEIYSRYISDFDSQLEERLIKIDSHVLKIYEDYFYRIEQGKFEKITEPILSMYLQDSINTLQNRKIILNEELNSLQYEINQFVAERNNFFEELNKYCYETIENDKLLDEVPLIILEVTDGKFDELKSNIFIADQFYDEMSNNSYQTAELKELLESEKMKTNLNLIDWVSEPSLLSEICLELEKQLVFDGIPKSTRDELINSIQINPFLTISMDKK